MKNNQKYFESCPLCGANDHIENHIPEEYERKYLDKKLTFDDLEETLRSGNIEELREISTILISHITDSINYYSELTNKISNYVLIFSVINLLSIAVVIYFLIKVKKTT